VPETLISSPIGVLFTLCAVAAFWFFLEQKTGWKAFQFLPPLIWIYATPVVLNNLHVLPNHSIIYSGLSLYALPAFIVLMLMKVNLGAALRVMGPGLLVMLMGSAGIVVGGVVSYFIVHGWLADDAWKGFGALAGSWIGGTGNMAAVAEGLGTSPEQFGLAVLADNLVYVVWLPILLASKGFADRFNAWARVPADRLERMDAAAVAAAADERERRIEMRDYLYLAVIAIGLSWLASALAAIIPEIPPILSTSTWKILLITTMALGLSATPLRKLPGTTSIATAIIYVFVAGMGARASLAGLAQAPAFVLGAFIWISIHGLFCLAGAWLFKVDVHSAAIASAANVGGAASAPVVAAYHRANLVPVSILMALIGYALGNYLALLTANFARLAAGQ
jgi:uncharacterized membrane protein